MTVTTNQLLSFAANSGHTSDQKGVIQALQDISAPRHLILAWIENPSRITDAWAGVILAGANTLNPPTGDFLLSAAALSYTEGNPTASFSFLFDLDSGAVIDSVSLVHEGGILGLTAENASVYGPGQWQFNESKSLGGEVADGDQYYYEVTATVGGTQVVGYSETQTFTLTPAE